MPKAKKNSSTSDSDSGPDDATPPPSKKSKESTSDNKSKDGENIWILEKQRQVRISEFRGRHYIDIREFYEKDGKSLPSKKGISLSVSQWKKLLEVSGEVNRVVDKL